jgi:SPP1 gp7 family putative phage head morphogenesis protein
MYLFKNYSLKDWVIFAEVYGMPLRLGKYEPGATSADKDALLDAVRSIGTDAAGIISKNTEIEFIESAKGGGSRTNIYAELAEFCDRQVSKAVLGHTGSAESTPGKLGSEHEAREVRQDLIEADCEALGINAIREQLIRPLVGFNFGWDKPVPWFRFAFEPPEDLKAISDIYINLSKIGYPLTVEHVSERFGVPIPGDDETPLVPQGGGGFGGMPFAAKKDVDRAGLVIAAGRAAQNAQAEIDRLAGDATDEAVPLFGPILAVIERAAETARSLADLRAALPDLYERIYASGFVQHLSTKLLRADTIGRESIESETGGTRDLRALRALKAPDRTGRIVAQTAEFGPGLPFEEAIEFYRDRAFAIAGVTKAELLLEVKAELLRAMEEGLTLQDFRDKMPGMFERHGYAALNPWRVKTIYATNLQDAYQGGRYAQKKDAAVMALRPWWRYVAVMDAATRPSHAAMHGRIFRADDPIWDTWHPPNGFNCRCDVVTLSEREIERYGWKPEEKDPTGSLFEPIDPATGDRLPARALIPDPGWDHLPGRGDLKGLLAEKMERLRS